MNKKTLYQFLFPVMIAGIGTLSISCSGDDSSGDLPNIPLEPTGPEEDVPEEEPFVGVTCFEDSVKIQLQLLNSDSVATDIFKEGEDIIFMLTVKNISRERSLLHTPIEHFSDNIFNIYSSDGTDMGRPWDYRICPYVYPFLTPEMVWEFVCSWLEEPDEDMVNLCLWIENPDEGIGNMNIEKYMDIWPMAFLKKERRLQLPKGSYYTQFDVSVLEGRTTIRMDFKVE